MAEEAKTKIKVRVKRSKIPIRVQPDLVRYQLAITFYTDKIPPQTIFMWEDEWSPEKEREEIMKRIKAMLPEAEAEVEVA